MEWIANWIKPKIDPGDVVPVFTKCFCRKNAVLQAKLYVTAIGVYEVTLNGQRVGDYIMAPGWTAYPKRLQYQVYDVTELINAENRLEILVGKGWYRSRLGWKEPSEYQNALHTRPYALLAQLEITYEDGQKENIVSNETWEVAESCVRFSEIYDGEIYDASLKDFSRLGTELYVGPNETLIPQEGEEIREQERIGVANVFVTPKQELVLDFGQNLTGYVEISLKAKAGDVVDLSFAEVMDREGNFYTENYRSAKSQYHYVCKEGDQQYKPKFTFYGFRYIRINQFPTDYTGRIEKFPVEAFVAIVVHSEMKRTGYLSCSNPLLNQLFDNIIWGQKGNFLDVPTDCPQRDERLGWTGDAQVFIRTACLNYDVEKFFGKWLADMAAEQHEDGYVGQVIPDLLQAEASAAWGDAATICPWEIYLAYGNPQILATQFTCMCKWVDYIGTITNDKYLWTGGKHYCDWLALDAPPGSYRGSTRAYFISSAYYAHSVSLVVKAGKILGRNVKEYEELYAHIVEAFRKTYPEYLTQTECILAVHFGLTMEPQKTVDLLARKIHDCGEHLETGFVGTPYLLHVLSDYGYEELAYSLLLREEYPSWLYSVKKGATTIWEHWDGMKEDGSFWSAKMNSFNHYAYGSVADWVYSVAGGIMRIEEYPGYEQVRIEPKPDKHLEWLKVELQTRHGLIHSSWKKTAQGWRYDIKTPVIAEIIIAGEKHYVKPGSYVFFSK